MPISDENNNLVVGSDGDGDATTSGSNELAGNSNVRPLLFGNGQNNNEGGHQAVSSTYTSTSSSDDDEELLRFPNNNTTTNDAARNLTNNSARVNLVVEMNNEGDHIDSSSDDDDEGIDIEFPQRPRGQQQQQQQQQQQSLSPQRQQRADVEVPPANTSIFNLNDQRREEDDPAGVSEGGHRQPEDDDDAHGGGSAAAKKKLLEIPPHMESTSRQSTIETVHSHHTLPQGNLRSATNDDEEQRAGRMADPAADAASGQSNTKHVDDDGVAASSTAASTPAAAAATAAVQAQRRRASRHSSLTGLVPHNFPFWVWVQVYKDEVRNFINGITFNAGDFGCICQLFFDNLSTILGVLYATQDLERVGNVSSATMTNVIYQRVAPGIGLSLLLGNTYYSWMATRQAKKYGRPYTAQPYGINTVQSFALVFNVICKSTEAFSFVMFVYQLT